MHHKAASQPREACLQVGTGPVDEKAEEHRDLAARHALGQQPLRQRSEEKEGGAQPREPQSRGGSGWRWPQLRAANIQRCPACTPCRAQAMHASPGQARRPGHARLPRRGAPGCGRRCPWPRLRLSHSRSPSRRPRSRAATNGQAGRGCVGQAVVSLPRARPASRHGRVQAATHPAGAAWQGRWGRECCWEVQSPQGAERHLGGFQRLCDAPRVAGQQRGAAAQDGRRGTLVFHQQQAPRLVSEFGGQPAGMVGWQ